jgi:hypothetical protein
MRLDEITLLPPSYLLRALHRRVAGAGTAEANKAEKAECQISEIEQSLYSDSQTLSRKTVEKREVWFPDSKFLRLTILISNFFLAIIRSHQIIDGGGLALSVWLIGLSPGE